MVTTADIQFPSSDGENIIHAKKWTPEGAPKGILQIVHGVAEYIERYDAFARFMADSGYVVAGNDHLGHGHSVKDDNGLGWFSETDGWDHLVDDVKTLHDTLAAQYLGLPAVILGHSMGSFVTRTYICRYPADFTACILSGTGHQPAAVCKAGMVMAKSEIRKHGSRCHSKKLQNLAFGSYLKGIENPIGANDWICRSEDVIRRYDDDPLCGFDCSAGLMYDMMSGLDYICRGSNMEKMRKTMPVLFISGEADPVGGWGKGVKTVASRFIRHSMRDITVKLYPGARHEILNELNKQEVWDDVRAWVGQKV